nr:MAG TPA: hypothetical protein [Caudoviricetes sp.]
MYLLSTVVTLEICYSYNGKKNKMLKANKQLSLWETTVKAFIILKTRRCKHYAKKG